MNNMHDENCKKDVQCDPDILNEDSECCDSRTLCDCASAIFDVKHVGCGLVIDLNIFLWL
jgi:hypothetical protein